MEMKEVFSVNLQNENRCFSLRQKLTIPRLRNKEYNGIFKHVHQNIRTYRRRKKTALINDWESIVYWEEFEQSEELVNKFGLFQVQLEGLMGVATPGNCISST